MKKIYIVITYTGTALSKIIKYYLRSEFSHVSISLDENLEEMYTGVIQGKIRMVGPKLQAFPGAFSGSLFQHPKS